MNNGIYVSINPVPVSKIIQGIKNHEFRNYIPKKDFDSFINYLVKEYGENILLSYKTPISEDTDNVEIALRTFSNLSNSEKAEFLKRIDVIKSKLKI